jgi:hypothetical protein
MRLMTTIGLAALACATFAQQPNTGGIASMTINSVDGPPYPIQTNVRTNTENVFQIQGLTNANFVIVRSATGAVQPGSATYFGDLCDLPISPALVTCIDGVANPAFATDLTGLFTFVVNCPPPGNPPTGIPLGHNAAYQAAIIDYFSPFGWSLTAATRVTVIQGPTIVNMNTGIGTYGDSGQATVSLSTYGFSVPFYGNNHTILHVSGDGYMTFGGGQVPDFTPSSTEMNGGPPRIAGMWTDLDQLGSAVVRYIVDASPPGGNPPFIQVEFINVGDAVVGSLHSMSWKIDNLGNVTIVHPPTQNAGVYDSIVGIGPGNNLNPQSVNKNLSTLLSPNSYNGAINESFYEWFGIVSLNPYYTLGTDNPFDLYARTLNFLPTGAGALPGSTNRYVLY